MKKHFVKYKEIQRNTKSSTIELIIYTRYAKTREEGKYIKMKSNERDKNKIIGIQFWIQ